MGKKRRSKLFLPKHMEEASGFEKPKVAFIVMTPMWRELSAITAWSVEKAHQVGIPFFWSPHPGDALIGRARSIMATRFLEEYPVDYLIMVDSDIRFEPEDLVKIWMHLQNGYQLIGGLYTVRSNAKVAHHGVDGNLRIDGQVQELDYLSTGFMGIHKDLLKRMVKELELPLCHEENEFRLYPFFESGRHLYHGQWIFRSEDWDFCDKARQLGVKPYCDTSISLGHEGAKVFSLNDMKEAGNLKQVKEGEGGTQDSQGPSSPEQGE